MVYCRIDSERAPDDTPSGIPFRAAYLHMCVSIDAWSIEMKSIVDSRSASNNSDSRRLDYYYHSPLVAPLHFTSHSIFGFWNGKGNNTKCLLNMVN